MLCHEKKAVAVLMGIPELAFTDTIFLKPDFQ